MPKIQEIIKKYADTNSGVKISFWESVDFVKELTAAVEEVYNTGMANGSNFVGNRVIEFIQTGK